MSSILESAPLNIHVLEHVEKEGHVTLKAPAADSRSKTSRPSLVQKNQVRVLQACMALAIDPAEMKMK